MLVLARKKDEAIIIGDDIKVFIVDIRGDKVRLGIEAPSDVSIHRQEVYEAIQRELLNGNVINVDTQKVQDLKEVNFHGCDSGPGDE